MKILVQQTVFYSDICKMMTECTYHLTTQADCISKKAVPDALCTIIVKLLSLQSFEEDRKVKKKVLGKGKLS